MRQLIRGVRHALLIAVTFTSTVGLATSQDGVAVQSKLVSSDGYARILDMIFPHDSVSSLKVGFTMVLRFEPNQGSESQLLFRVWHDGHVAATSYTVKGGSAWNLANDYMARTGKEDDAAISRSIAVEEKQLKVNLAEVERWHAGLFETLRASDSYLQKTATEYAKDGTREAVLDGTRYELWYWQGETELHWDFSDIDLNDAPTRANLPLARWMNAVRIAAVKKQ